MRKAFWLGAVAALAIACGNNTSKSTQQTPAGDRPIATGNTTVTGCLARADVATGSVGTAGSATGSSAAPATTATTATPAASAIGTERYVLRQPPATSSSPAAGGVGTAGLSYPLEGDRAELQSHVGQQVEVTGKLESTGSDAAGQHLTVASIRTIADTCPAQ